MGLLGPKHFLSSSRKKHKYTSKGLEEPSPLHQDQDEGWQKPKPKRLKIKTAMETKPSKTFQRSSRPCRPRQDCQRAQPPLPSQPRLLKGKERDRKTFKESTLSDTTTTKKNQDQYDTFARVCVGLHVPESCCTRFGTGSLVRFRILVRLLLLPMVMLLSTVFLLQVPPDQR